MRVGGRRPDVAAEEGAAMLVLVLVLVGFAWCFAVGGVGGWWVDGVVKVDRQKCRLGCER